MSLQQESPASPSCLPVTYNETSLYEDGETKSDILNQTIHHFSRQNGTNELSTENIEQDLQIALENNEEQQVKEETVKEKTIENDEPKQSEQQSEQSEQSEEQPEQSEPEQPEQSEPEQSEQKDEKEVQLQSDQANKSDVQPVSVETVDTIKEEEDEDETVDVAVENQEIIPDNAAKEDTKTSDIELLNDAKELKELLKRTSEEPSEADDTNKRIRKNSNNAE